MRCSLWRWSPLTTLLLLFVTSIVGCSSKPVDDKADTRHLQRLATFYGRYASTNQGKSPANEAVFKKFLETLSKDELTAQKWDLTNVASNFTSPRDQEQYVIRYGLKQSLFGPPDQMPVVIYEKTGVNGKRLVAFGMGKVDEVDDAKFRELVPDAK